MLVSGTKPALAGNRLTRFETLTASNAYGRYCVPASSRHRPAAKAILKGTIWEAETIAFLASRCGDGDIVHAGTYFGDFLPALSTAAAPGARIWAFEPSSENLRCAEITLELNDIRNVTLTHAALGDHTGTALLYTGPTGQLPCGGASEIRTKRAPGGDYEDVALVTIDRVVPENRRVSIIQLDVEHYEQQALAGAIRTIRRCRPILVLENLPADQEWFRENVMGLGYRRYGRINANLVLMAKQPCPGPTESHV